MESKVALVTGGTAGIGRAAAVAFARRGARVVVCGRREAEGEQTMQLVRAAGGDGFFVQADVSDELAVQQLIQAIVDRYDRLDYAFNNAGVGGIPGPMADGTRENWDYVSYPRANAPGLVPGATSPQAGIRDVWPTDKGPTSRSPWRVHIPKDTTLNLLPDRGFPYRNRQGSVLNVQITVSTGKPASCLRTRTSVPQTTIFGKRKQQTHCGLKHSASFHR